MSFSPAKPASHVLTSGRNHTSADVAMESGVSATVNDGTVDASGTWVPWPLGSAHRLGAAPKRVNGALFHP